MFHRIRQLFQKQPDAELFIGQSFDPFRPRAGKSKLSNAVDHAIVASGAQPGDIVEVDKHGTARVVGRRPCLAGEELNLSEHAIRARLTQLYGDDVPNLADVERGSNVVVFKNRSVL